MRPTHELRPQREAPQIRSRPQLPPQRSVRDRQAPSAPKITAPRGVTRQPLDQLNRNSLRRGSDRHQSHSKPQLPHGKPQLPALKDHARKPKSKSKSYHRHSDYTPLHNFSPVYDKHRHHHQHHHHAGHSWKRPSLWFHLSFSSGHFRAYHTAPWWHCPPGLSWRSAYWPRPRRHWAWYPTWSSWPTVYYVRPLARPIYSTVYHNTTVVTQPAPPAPAPDPCAFEAVEAWEFLAEANVHYALEAFACQAREYSTDGLMHVGYALTNAMLGADESAVSVMRHAVLVDPQSLLYVPADSRIDEQIQSLLHHYGELAAEPAKTRDALFMIATLRTALHDHAGAYFAITEAISHGATETETMQLREMLATLLQEQMLQRG